MDDNIITGPHGARAIKNGTSWKSVPEGKGGGFGFEVQIEQGTLQVGDLIEYGDAEQTTITMIFTSDGRQVGEADSHDGDVTIMVFDDLDFENEGDDGLVDDPELTTTPEDKIDDMMSTRARRVRSGRVAAC